MLLVNLRKRCIKRRFKEILDRFFTDPEFRASQLEIMIEMKRSVSRCTSLRRQIFPFQCDVQEE